ncbi:hypothetical protein V2G26_011135 [Clonostachys chloroleuca]
MAPASKEPKGQKELDVIVNATLELIQRLQTVLSDINRNPTATSTSSAQSSGQAPLNSLALAQDSSALVRAHATKVSLLIVNEPFTPSALVGVIRELAQGPLPSLAASAETCTADRYTAVFRKELAWRCRSVLLELAKLLEKIPKDGKALSASEQGFSADKGSIALTGVLWAACDQVAVLTKGGVGGFFVKKVEEWRDTLKDVMEELKEWGEQEPDDDDDDEDEERDDPVHDTSEKSKQSVIDDFMSSDRTIPKSDPDKIRPRLETSLKRLRLVTLLYQAIVKRRIKKLPAIPPPEDADESARAVPTKLNDAAHVLEVLPDHFGDLAAAIYDLDPEEIDEMMDQCFTDAETVSNVLGQTWEGGKDEFTEWTEKFKTEIRKA